MLLIGLNDVHCMYCCRAPVGQSQLDMSPIRQWCGDNWISYLGQRQTVWLPAAWRSRLLAYQGLRKSYDVTLLTVVAIKLDPLT